ncbi:MULTISPECIES: flagellar biosynthesis protein FlhB [unclassified Butyrivibrio]|uniref:flagellar biosynthesis protein FlhB n=1 Tax=unclassified Butyrivibrio TaxID=2639466 RepID=UPI0003B7508C|nr:MULTISPECIES: flagellar biosynthesis protein FlhB [unclassified Butyrivibrio]SDB39332.1 flagellar biosynthetic protein FlhB [Butyrivibrio sp. INlla16]SEK44046.1 flagellar biosynthetic protein FlhB [Butyrivibrio sp. ob235]
MTLCEEFGQLNNGLMISYDLQFFADGPGGEKTEEPTAKKLQDARNEGQVANSREVGNAAGLLALFIMIRLLYGYMGNNFSGMFKYVYTQIPDIIIMHSGNTPFQNITAVMKHAVIIMFLTALPFFAAALLIGLVSNVAQVGWKVTSKPLQPKLSKLNPINGFKKIFSSRSLFELFKSIAKIAIISFVVYNYFTGVTASLFTLYDMPLKQAIGLMGSMVIDVGIRIAAIYVIIAAADVVFQRRKFKKDMRMTKQEVKDEYKNTEGDPQIKGQQRRRMMQASQRRMMQELPQADVVITNPTHYAVAISYDADLYDAPKVVAKGEDYLAQRIKDVAKEHGIEIVENKPLARMLYANVEVGEFVPPELYQAVAEVLAFVYHLQGKV